MDSPRSLGLDKQCERRDSASPVKTNTSLAATSHPRWPRRSHMPLGNYFGKPADRTSHELAIRVSVGVGRELRIH